MTPKQTKPAKPAKAPDTARSVALEALLRIDKSQAYANLALGPILDRSTLDERDRRLVTELVYGSLRQRGSCDYLVNRFLSSDPPIEVRMVLRLGAYQLRYTDIPDHAAVSATVALADGRFKGLVNAVLRKVASSHVEWPDMATRLSYPQWIVDIFVDELGEDAAESSLSTMNKAPTVTMREDGYIQDESSQLVASLVHAGPDDLVADVCSAPGGKATAMALGGATVIGADRKMSRAKLVKGNAEKLNADRVLAVVSDATKPALRPGSADWVLVDAPCSGLGVLRRRADARWRIQPTDIETLGELQEEILASSAALVKPGGYILYSICTVTRRESIEVADVFTATHPEFSPVPLAEPWAEWGTGGIVLPHDDDNDGMCAFLWNRADG